jgi:hypothetical protein
LEDVEELRGILSAIVDFVRDIKGPLTDLVKSVMGSVSGPELGEDVGTFYKKLKEGGVPDDVAVRLTEEYLEARLSAFKSIEKALSKLSEAADRWKVEVKAEEE